MRALGTTDNKEQLKKEKEMTKETADSSYWQAVRKKSICSKLFPSLPPLVRTELAQNRHNSENYEIH